MLPSVFQHVMIPQQVVAEVPGRFQPDALPGVLIRQEQSEFLCLSLDRFGEFVLDDPAGVEDGRVRVELNRLCDPTTLQTDSQRQRRHGGGTLMMLLLLLTTADGDGPRVTLRRNIINLSARCNRPPPGLWW